MPTNTANSRDVAAVRHIVFVVFPQTKLLDVSGPLQVFQDARNPDDQNAYRVTLASVSGGRIETDTCVQLDTVSFSSLRKEDIHTVLVSGGSAALRYAKDAALLDGMRDLTRHARRTGSICTGAFILAAGGYLSGRQATTHWMHCDALDREAPEVRVNADAIFVVDDNVWTSAGVSSGIDMALAMVEADLGRAEALRLARALVLYLKRPGGQSQFSTSLQRQVDMPKRTLDTLLRWIDDNLAQTLSVEKLAEIANMSARTFARNFKKETGSSPAAYVEMRRIEEACRLLEDNNRSLKAVCGLVGFQSEETFRRAFVKLKGIAPSAYSTHFGKRATESP